MKQSRPLIPGNSPKPKKHEDVPSLDLQLSKSNEGLRELAKVFILMFFNELCLGKATVAYTKPQQWRKEESKRLRGERSDQVC